MNSPTINQLVLLSKPALNPEHEAEMVKLLALLSAEELTEMEILIKKYPDLLHILSVLSEDKKKALQEEDRNRWFETISLERSILKILAKLSEPKT